MPQRVAKGVERTLTGEGFGDTKKAANDDALASLASEIFVEIESNSQTFLSERGENYFESTIQSNTELPLMGTEIDCFKISKKEYRCRAEMDLGRALPLYRAQLERLMTDIKAQYAAYDAGKIVDKHQLLTATLTTYTQLEKMQVVITYLTGSGSAVELPSPGRQQLVDRITALETQVGTLELAGSLIARGIKQQNVLVKPAAFPHSRETTPFASALRSYIERDLSTVSSEDAAEYIYSGRYQQHDKGIQVTYTLSDRVGKVAATRVVDLEPSAYAKYRIEPLVMDFDRMLHEGYAVSSDLRVEVGTNRGSRQLLFSEGDEVTLWVKLNRPGYYFIVGHIKNDEQELSYLLDLQESGDDHRFVKYVDAADANKRISLGSFEVQAPFGVESLQVVAGQEDLVGNLPPHRYDLNTGYYVISHDITKGAARTRGLKRPSKKSPTQKVETVMIFTTEGR